MQINRTSAAFRRLLLGATSLTLALTGATAAAAQTTGTGNDQDPTGSAEASSPEDSAIVVERPTGSEEYTDLVIRNDLNPGAPPPAGVLDSGINGVGQMTVRSSPTSTSMGTCTGTLINPRMVIFAAHCVNTRPAEAYGPNGIPNGAHTAGGTPIAFGFSAFNLPAVRKWLGLDGGTAGATNVADALYAVEQVWYDPRSRSAASCTSATSCFLQADIAIATLDTPAFDIPSWAMLFSPLDGPTHATITGYGNSGRENSASISIDWRRRSAENMISVLGSLTDRNMWLFGTPNQAKSNVYLLDFRDPNPGYNPSLGKYDFGLYGSVPALTREGTTAGGDSGGPLIVDQKYDRPVVAGVLSGGSRFFNAQAGHRYGTDSFFQPLHLYWDVIVANNPYVYAGNKGGTGNWEDASHWVQLMDPSYMIDVGGKLVNGLPDTAAQGDAAGGAKFGQICFLANCTTLTGTQTTGDGTPAFVPGGPGSTDFVPNNVRANPAAGVRARYYDVTLSAPGTTNLGSAVTIDRMTLDGQTRLNVAKTGTLNVLGTYNQVQGWTNVDGRIETGRDMLLVSGMLSGSGTVKAPFVTAVGAIVAPGGGDRIGTLTIDGGMILASASSLFIDASRNGADKLAVTGGLALSGGSLVFNKVTDGPAPRHGQKFDIATAASLTGTFGNVFSFQGVLRPALTYTSTTVTAELRAGSLVTILDGQNATALAFAGALDRLRDSSYTNLYGLYGAVDLMGGAALSATLSGLAPRIAGETLSLQDRQSKVMLGTVTDRLSILAGGTAQGLSVVGNPHSLIGNGGDLSIASAQGQGFSSLAPSTQTVNSLPKGVTGFLAGGVTAEATGYGGNAANFGSAQRSAHVSMGLEFAVDDRLSFGTAFGYSSGASAPGADRTDSLSSQVAAYASYQLGGGAYAGGLVSAETSSANLSRVAMAGFGLESLRGAAESVRYNAVAEAGTNLAWGKLTVTPRVQLAYSNYTLSGLREAGGETALQIDQINLQRLEGRTGVKLAGATSIAPGWSIVPQLQADVVHLLSGADEGMNVRFASAPEFAFALPLAGGSTTWAEAKGGVKLVNGLMEIGAGMQTSVGRTSFRDDRAVVDFSLRF
jgi:uncharacterized protein with beta-barrel porin domain